MIGYWRAAFREAFAGMFCVVVWEEALRVVFLFILALTLLQSGCTPSPPLPDPQISRSDTQALQLFQLAQEHLQKNRLVEAEVALRRALVLQPRVESIGYSLGVVLEKIGDIPQAEKFFRSLSDSPRRTIALRRLRIRNGDQNAIRELETEYQAALKLGDFQHATRIGAALAGVKRELGDLVEADLLMYEISQF